MNLRVSYLVKANENFLSTHSIHINHHIFEKILKMMSSELSSCYGHLSFHRKTFIFFTTVISGNLHKDQTTNLH